MASSSNSAAYAELNKRWKQTCELLLKGSVGELADFEPWLTENIDKIHSHPSSLSGKEVAYSVNDYCAGSKRESFEEVDFSKKAGPLEINDIKDIDSIVEAVQERIYYTGGMVLGNSRFVEKSANVSDSFYVYSSSHVGDSKYIAYCSMSRLNEYAFGTAAPGESQYVIRCTDTYKLKRVFEGWTTANTTDSYYVFWLNNCADCMFSFNLRSTRNAIGNLVLPREKYQEIKARLLEQMRFELESKKRLPSFLDIIKKSSTDISGAKSLFSSITLPPEEKKSLAPIEAAFSHTSKIVLGTELRGLSAYSGWLKHHLRPSEKRKSVFSGREVFVAGYARYLDLPANRTALDDEAIAVARLAKQDKDVEKLTLANAHEYIGKFAYFSLDFHDGTNSNVNDCFAYAYSTNVLECYPCVQIKDSAYNFWPRSSEHLFGCGVLFDSQFCIHCYQSVKLSRCFEVDSSRDCADCYFSHNIENCQSCIFCFNVKNLRYAIGNVEVGKEKFASAKEALLRQVGAKLQKEKDFEMDIFNIACRKS